MIVMLEVFALWFVAASVVYFLVAVYSHSVHREKLEKEFDAGGAEGTKDDYIKAGMEHYKHGLRRRLILLVYLVPAVALAVIIYFVNYR